ncbi:MAG: hypothetical protein ACE5H9_17820 [Anaerolineae bacterium]
MSKARQALEQRARRAIIEHAIFRWESAVVIALTIVLAFVFFNVWWLVVAAGGLAEAILVGVSLTSEDENAKAVAAMLREEFNPRRLKNTTLQDRLNKALEYWRQIDATVRASDRGILRDRLERTTNEIEDWVESIYRLAQRLDSYQQDRLIKRDLQAVPKTINDLRHRLSDEDDPTVRSQLEQTIADKERQWQHLEKLQNTMEKAEYQMESTLSALGTVYSQLLLVGTRDDHAQRLQEEIHEQVSQLQDLTEAMDEIYLEQ